MVYTMEDALGAPPGEFLKVWLAPSRFVKLALKRRMVSDQVLHNQKVSKVEMRKELSWFSYACMGVGSIIATGIFSFMPYIYANITGPAVVLSLLIASGAAAFSALIYSEFAVEYPVVGGGFVYVLNTFGEYPAVLCAVNLVIDYIFGTAAVVRNFSVYFSELIDKNHDIFQKNVSFQSDQIDYLALIVCIFLTIVAIWSTKAFDEGNIILQVFHVFLVVFTFCAAFAKAETKNWTPFFPSSLSPHGPRTIVTGASNIFFVFIGYDVVALGAEEAKTDLSVPIGMLASVVFVTIIYVLMAASLVMLYPFADLASQPKYNTLSGFAFAFTQRGMTWAKYIVALGACIGIFTSTGIGIYGLSRIIQVFARESMIPSIIGQVHPYTRTPIIAIAISGAVSGCIAFFTGFSSLANMTSIGTLTMYWFVAIAHLYRRYAPGLEEEDRYGDRHLQIPFRPDPFGSMLGVTGKRALALTYIFFISASSIGWTIYWNESTGSLWLILCAVAWLVSTLALQLTMPITYVPAKFALPWWSMPWIPALSVFSNCMLVGGFGAHKGDYIRLFVAMGIGTVVYWLYGVHASNYRFYGEGRVKELEFQQEVVKGQDQ